MGFAHYMLLSHAMKEATWSLMGLLAGGSGGNRELLEREEVEGMGRTWEGTSK